MTGNSPGNEPVADTDLIAPIVDELLGKVWGLVSCPDVLKCRRHGGESVAPVLYVLYYSRYAVIYDPPEGSKSTSYENISMNSANRAAEIAWPARDGSGTSVCMTLWHHRSGMAFNSEVRYDLADPSSVDALINRFISHLEEYHGGAELR